LWYPMEAGIIARRSANLRSSPRKCRRYLAMQQLEVIERERCTCVCTHYSIKDMQAHHYSGIKEALLGMTLCHSVSQAKNTTKQ
jgi:hypothetical protein